MLNRKNVKQLYFLFSLEGSTLMLINMQLYDTKHIANVCEGDGPVETSLI